MKQTPLTRKTPIKPSGPIPKKTSGEKKPRRRLKKRVASKCLAKEEKGKQLDKMELSAVCAALWSKVVLASVGHTCEWCGAEAVHAHHMIFRRRCLFLRFDLRNGVALCAECHLVFHEVESDTGWTLFREQRPLSYEYIRANKRTRANFYIQDYRDIRTALEIELKELGE